MENPDAKTGFNFQKRTALNRAVSHVAKKETRPPRILQRHQSLVAFEDLVLCEICHAKLQNHRMLLCQHTFCLDCLDSYFISTNTSIKHASGDNNTIDVNFDQTSKHIKCPICQTPTPLENGHKSIKELPKNMQVEKLLKIVNEDNDPSMSLTYRCVKCQTVGCEAGQSCLHCMQDFCNICWPDHHQELDASITNLVKQLEDCNVKLDHKMELLETRLKQLVDLIESTTVAKIQEIKEEEQTAIDSVQMLLKQSKVGKNHILETIDNLKGEIDKHFIGNSEDKVSHYMKFHRETSKLLDNIQRFGEGHIHFNSETFKLEKDGNGIHSLLQTVESQPMSRNVYKLKSSSKPKLVWEKCPRPGHVAIPPWDCTKLYIATTDNKSVLVLSIDRLKLLQTLSSSEMLYPQSITFCAESEEIFVSDKWKHCVHVFSRSGDYLRVIGNRVKGVGDLKSPDGIALGIKNQLYVCDTTNNKIVIFDSKSGEYLSVIGNEGNLNQPTDVASKGDRLYVADSGNHRIKIFNNQGILIQEIGSLGSGSGQLRSPEVLTVDVNGNILVGDSGNARIQVFDSDGTLVKILGGTQNKFQSVSGICVSGNFDIIVTDNKAKCLRII